MKALVLQDDKQLKFESVPTPALKSNSVLVKLEASSLNHRDLWIQQGLYPGMKLPCILGADGAGIITKLGDEVNQAWLNKEVIIYPAYGWGLDDHAPLHKFRVLGMPDPGTFAEYIEVPLENVFEKPAYLSWTEAAAFPIAGLTAWRALVSHGNISAGSKVLITGIGGGVAQVGLRLAKAFGSEIYVTSSSAEKIQNSILDGAKGGVSYRDEDWHQQLKTLSGGIDLVLDSSPSENLDNYLKFMNYGGKIIAYGSTGSRKTTLNISKFFLRHIQFIGTAMGSPKEFGAFLKFVTTHEVRPKIHSEFKFDEAILALNQLKEGTQEGKIVLRH